MCVSLQPHALTHQHRHEDKRVQAPVQDKAAALSLLINFFPKMHITVGLSCSTTNIAWLKLTFNSFKSMYSLTHSALEPVSLCARLSFTPPCAVNTIKHIKPRAHTTQRTRRWHSDTRAKAQTGLPSVSFLRLGVGHIIEGLQRAPLLLSLAIYQATHCSHKLPYAATYLIRAPL